MAEKQETTSKIGIPLVFLAIGVAFIKRLVTSPFRGSNGAPTYRRDVFYAALRKVLSDFTAAQGQWLLPKTDTVYKLVARIHNSKPTSIDLGNGAKGHWIGEKGATYVMLYFHGGGFFAPSTSGHIQYQFAIQEHMGKQGHDISIFSMSYTLSPLAVYPVQLSQAASALRHLLEVEHRDPSTIIIGGDSAGGNLASALLLHLAHPHSSIPSINLTRPLHAALLISPWISYGVEDPSFRNNSQSDYLTIRAVTRAANLYMAPGSQHDNYSQPGNAPAEWWENVADKVLNEIMIWGGGGEVLIDSIRKFAHTVKNGFADADGRQTVRAASASSRNRFRFVVTPEHAHEEMIIDHLLGIRKSGKGAREIEDWMINILR